MSTKPREALWVLLSELFVDTEHTKKDLLAIGKSLRETGFSVEEVETILLREVAPVCGRWMLYPGAIGPWPMVDEQELKEKIEERLRKPWYKQSLFNKGLMFMPGVKRKWENIRNAMRSQPDT
jgi:hypothetical protein